jgi:hypothetical protein
MSDKSPQKSNAKKQPSSTLKEKRAAKKTKKSGGSDSRIPPTGH